MNASLRQRLHDPVLWTNTSQLIKTVLAAVIAWLLAVHVFHISQAFLAPWAALLTVHATVFRTLKRGVQQVGASVLGVLLAFAAGSLLGLNALSLGLVLLAGLLAGSVRGLRSETTTAAATALVVLTAGYSNDGGMLVARLLDTGIGIAVGLLVNLLVWPPLRDRAAAHQVGVIDDRIGELLSDMAAAMQRGCREEDIDGWIARTGELDHDVDQAWSVVRQARESGRFNPRRGAAGRMRAAEDFEPILARVEQAVAEARSMARTIRLARIPPEHWHPSFRGPWLDLLARAGRAISGADKTAVEAVGADLEAFAGALDVDELPRGFWPVGGALLVNLRNIVDALGAVADRQPLEVPAPALTTLSRPGRAAVRG
jgi:cell shape-determining protein MreD